MLEDGEIIAGAVLAGGQSSRMGRDKALLQWRGQSLLEKAVGSLQAVCGPVRVVGRARPESWRGDVAFLADDPLGTGIFPSLSSPVSAGPLAGLLTLLGAFPAPTLVIACDMPALETTLLAALLAAWRQTRPAALLAAMDATGPLEPLLGVYSGEILGQLQEKWARGDRSLQRWRGGVERWVVPVEFRAQLININDPQAWEHFGKHGMS